MTGRVPQLDGLRGIAVLLVMVFHFSLFGCANGTDTWSRAYSAIAGLGWVGVDLFFVLSGFLITGILYDSRSNGRYYRVFYGRRTVRIFPLYYAMLATVFWIVPLVLRLLNKPNRIFPASAGRQALAWLYWLNWSSLNPTAGKVTTVLAHFWSLSIEEQFYFAWPLIVRSLTRRALLYLCIGLIAGSFLLRAAFHLIGMPEPAYDFTLCRMDGLALGALLAITIREQRDWARARRSAPTVMTAAVICMAIAIVVAGATDFDNRWMELMGISSATLFFGAALVRALDVPGGWISRATSWNVLRFFGKYSYGLYVLHQPIILVMAHSGLAANDLVPRLHGRLLAVLAVNVVALACSVLAAILSWNFLEKQFLKLKSRPALNY